MAKISMTLSGVAHFKEAIAQNPTTEAIELSVGNVIKTSEIFVSPDSSALNVSKYLLTLVNFDMHKKMYQPTEIIAQISIGGAEGEGHHYTAISRKVIESMFKHAKVSVLEDDFNVGDKFYVLEVLPQYLKNQMLVTLKIYSLDKLMTLQKTSRTFVGQKLSSILEKEALNYLEPSANVVISDKWAKKNAKLKEKKDDWDNGADERKKAKNGDDSKAYEKAVKAELDYKKELQPMELELKELPKFEGTPIAIKTKNMKKLVYFDKQPVDKSKSGQQWCEHIHHYLVQYNESFYDMVVRTCNRWGEFLFYEDGALNLGYDATVNPIDVAALGFDSISFFDLNSKGVSGSQKGNFELEADNSAVKGWTLEESPFIPKGQMGYSEERYKPDKWIMKQFPTIFKNDKNLPTLLTNLLFDNMFSLAMAKSSTAKLNSDADDKYFANIESPEYKQHYGKIDFANAKKLESKREKNAYQEFTELNSAFDGKRYASVLQKELSVGEDAVHIEFNTTSPKLKLGSIITYNDELFIVVEIKSQLNKDKAPVFEVVATARDNDKNDGQLFYPAVIPSGHVRYAHPQEATITDADDPTGFNKVRVLFNWQKEYLIYNDDDNKLKGCSPTTLAASTPWLTFASNSQGAPVSGYHYVGYPVMVGFVDGNVERPYVIGGLMDDFITADTVMQTEGGQRLQISDGWGNGLGAFLSGCFSPLLKTITGFVPGDFLNPDFKKSRRFEGGFELTDYYGIYKVSGSTDGRNVSISSPWGDVKINSFTGINISAPNGDVKIAGKNVTIEAGNNLKLVSGTNVDYKLWKSQSNAKATAAQITLDVTAQVTKKIADLALSVVDLKLVRSMVEIFFRPVEGALTVKSNRFLKLEAGNKKCDYPAVAYNQKKKIELIDKMNKEAVVSSAGISQGVVDLFSTIPSLTWTFLARAANVYNDCVKDLTALDEKLSHLRKYGNQYPKDKKTYPFNTYEKLKDDLFNQEKDEDWAEDKMAFTDDLKIDGKPEDVVNPDLIMIPSGLSTEDKAKILKMNQTVLLKTRKRLRTEALDALNKLRKDIFVLTHLEPTKMEDIDRKIGRFKTKTMPKDFRKKLMTSFSKKKCEHAPFYELSDEEKKLGSLKLVASDDDRLYMTRLVAMNLLEELGFNDDTRRKDKNGVAKPKPKTERPSTGNDNIMNDICWGSYVSSLYGLPNLGADTTTLAGAIKGALKSAWDQKVNEVKLGGIFDEKVSWGEGSEGRILLSSGGNDTFYFHDDKIDKVEPIKPSFKSLSSNSDVNNKEQEAILNFMLKLKGQLLSY